MAEEKPESNRSRPPSREGEPQPPRLPDEVRQFIVTQLACYERIADVRRAAADAFPDLPEGVRIDDNRVRALDPTQARGQEMSPALKKLFWKVRNRFDKLAEEKLVGSLRHRLGVYDTVVARALSKGNEQIALQALKQAAQDKGGVFTNRRELSGPKGGPVETVSMSIEDWKKQAAKRGDEVEEIMSMFEEGEAKNAAAGEDGDA